MRCGSTYYLLMINTKESIKVVQCCKLVKYTSER
jgi:hypothetical protein